MAKNIVFCADGTWNGPGQADVADKSAPSTNVFKLYSNLAGIPSSDTTNLEYEE